MIKKKVLSLCLSLLTITALLAQDFGYEAEIDSVDSKGYYKVSLSSEMLGKLNFNQSDLRIYDEKGAEQPYFFIREKRVANISLFREYEILESAQRPDTISYLVFSNPTRAEIDNVSFVVKNTDVRKRARLSGSNDQENWFVIKNNYLLHSMQNNSETSELKILNFPLSDYAFFKLEIDDNWKLPINILKVGNYDYEQKKGISTSFECEDVIQNDSAKTTYLKLTFPERIYIDELQFDISGAEFYSRSVGVYVKNERLNRKKKTIYSYENIGLFNLNSNSSNSLTLDGLEVDELYLRIQNKDDAPLTIDGITAAHLNKYVVLELNPTSGYKMRGGDISVGKPDYDIVTFKSQLNIIPGYIDHSEIAVLKSESPSAEPSIFDSGYVIWSVLGVVGIFLAFISFKMIKEMGNKE